MSLLTKPELYVKINYLIGNYFLEGLAALMKIIYKDASVEKLCTTEKAAKRFFNDMRYFEDLKGVINLIDRSPVLSDLIAFPQLHFHPTDFYMTNSFGLDISGRKSMYRLIVVPLDDSENIVVKDDKFFSKCKQIRILRIEEVSKHYE